ncbi:ParB N-terminal domain-containing protein [Halonotius sp. F2-221B]|uniref:ParB/RepB/Spo0J family partition protein n=1 Tax=Halonotius sp. F2-221B TaxID=2731620 RepID=UPI00398A59D2
MKRAELPIESLVIDPMQSRDQAWTGDDTDQQLAAAIDTDGLYNDLIVRPVDAVEMGVTTDSTDSVDNGRDGDVSTPTTDGEYAIVAGSRRYYAAMEAGYETVPCKILQANDLDAAWTSLLENTDRRELSEQEIAQQLNLIYQLIRPEESSSGDEVTDTSVVPGFDIEQDRFDTDEEALAHMAERYCGRSDESAISHIEEHLQTAALPPVLQSLFKNPEERTASEQTALENYGIDTRATLGSGEGKSGTSRAVVALHDTFESELEADSIDPTNAVLETVGSLQFEEMSELELRQSLREFRKDVSTALDSESPTEHREAFSETLQQHTEELKELHEEIEPNRPFKRIDLQGPETQRHSRWHVQAMRSRGADTHTELARELYLERLETLADERGWE